MTGRDETLKVSKIDESYISELALRTWRETELEREENLERRRAFEDSWRTLTSRPKRSIWEGSSNFHVPISLIYGKAIHARLWQLFSSPGGFYSVAARQEVFRDREDKVKQFMDWLLKHLANSGHGIKNELDQWLMDVVLPGSGYLKGYWKRETREYMDTVTVVENIEQIVFEPGALTGRTITNTTATERDVVKEELFESPQIRRMSFEDVALPIGYTDPQDAPFVECRTYMTDDDLKEKAEQGEFFSEAVEEALEHKQNVYLQTDLSSQIKQDRIVSDGYEAIGYLNERHVIIEWYGKAFVEEGKDLNIEDLNQDVKKKKKEIVAWVHMATGKVLGWTYLYRISPSGIRPIFKADFMTFPERSDGVGAAELLYEISTHIDSVYNTRADSGQLASVPMFAYRSGSSLKPHMMRVRPGTGIPVDDINDIRQFQFPFLSNYGYQEEAQLTGYAERLLSISDLNLGRAPDKVGALRNATGSNLLASESGIQLQIHFDRIERTMSKLLQFVFQLTRERMSEEVYYRVTGDRGEAIFGKVDRKALGGQYDFEIAIDILSQTQLEKQQMATLALQTLITPAAMQSGVVTPENIYNMYKQYLKAHKFARVDDYLTPPQDYKGPVVTPAERMFRIVVGLTNGIEDTVTLGENHEASLKFYEDFQKQPEFGLIAGENRAEKLLALKRLIDRHMQYIQVVNTPGNPNSSGMQVPREGFEGVQGVTGGGGESLQSPVGEANGPVV